MIHSLEKAIHVLNYLAGSKQPLGVSDIARALDLPKATAYRILKTLEKYNYVYFDENTALYRLGWATLPLSKGFLESMDIRALAHPYMIEVQGKVNQSVNLFIADGDCRVCIERVQSQQPLRSVMRIGSVYPVFQGAAGKVFKAFLSEEGEAEKEMLDKQGYILTRGERVADAGSIAVPLLNYRQKLVAALAISGPIREYNDENVAIYSKVLVEAGQRISEQMGYEKNS